MSPIKPEEIISKVMKFLRLFMCETLVKRIMSMLLLSLGVEKSRVTELTGLCARSVHSLNKAMGRGDIERQFKIETGRGGKRKMQEIEEAIIEEVEKKDYYSQQQIADMIEEKFRVKVSSRSVGRLLKKTKSNG